MRLAAPLIVLAIFIDRPAVTQAMLSTLPSAPWLTHQTLHAIYVLIAYVAVQGYVFFRYSRTPPSTGGSATAWPAEVARTAKPSDLQRSTHARGSSQVSA